MHSMIDPQMPNFLTRLWWSRSDGSVPKPGSRNRPTRDPVKNPPRWPRTSIFAAPSKKERKRPMQMKSMIWHRLFGLVFKKFQFKIRNARYAPTSPYTAVDAPTLLISLQQIEKRMPPKPERKYRAANLGTPISASRLLPIISCATTFRHRCITSL